MAAVGDCCDRAARRDAVRAGRGRQDPARAARRRAPSPTATPTASLLVEFGDGGPDEVEPALAAALRLADGGRPGRLVRRTDRRGARGRAASCWCWTTASTSPTRSPRWSRRSPPAPPAIDVLLTSREPLRVDGEQRARGRAARPGRGGALLTDRIRAADPAAASGPSTTGSSSSEVCRRLDGLPLALELAAGPRAPRSGCAGCSTRWTTRARSRCCAAAGGPRRRGTARCATSSSGPTACSTTAQRTLFDRLSVFAGPVEAAAVGAVCGDARRAARPGRAVPGGAHPAEPTRFGMLETLRAFGRARLATDPDEPAAAGPARRLGGRLADELRRRRRGPGEPLAVAPVRRPPARPAPGARVAVRAPARLEDLLRLTLLFAELAYLRGRVDLVRAVVETSASSACSTPARRPAERPAGGPAARPARATSGGSAAT